MIKIEHNTQTGEILEIQLNANEKKAFEKQYAEAKDKSDVLALEAEAKEIAKAAILDRLGLTADELKTILG